MSHPNFDHTTDCALPWCDTTYGLPEEHLGTHTYTPATLGQNFQLDTSGVRFPVVGIGIVWDRTESADVPPAVSIHISGPTTDSDAELRIDEAKRVRGALDDAIRALEEGSQ